MSIYRQMHSYVGLKQTKEELKFYSLGIFCKAAETYTFGYLGYDFVVWNNKWFTLILKLFQSLKS